jgi:hypothetical protein
MAWEPIPPTLFHGALPALIRSSWVFILRAGASTGAERHPNSHQRMMSFEGTGAMQTDAEPAGGSAGASSDIVWHSHVLVVDPDAALERRWISIPQNVWHRQRSYLYVFRGQLKQLPAIIQIELVLDVLAMGLDGFYTQMQQNSDLLVAKSRP